MLGEPSVADAADWPTMDPRLRARLRDPKRHGNPTHILTSAVKICGANRGLRLGPET